MECPFTNEYLQFFLWCGSCGNNNHRREKLLIDISVLIPTYNNARFVGEAIQSVLNQTYKNYEIIVIDDGSTDNTGDIVARFNKRVKYIKQQNMGLSGARNTGILHAKGEFFAFLDSDDLWTPLFLAASIAKIQEDKSVGLTYSWWDYIDENGIKLPEQGKYIQRGNIFHELVISNRFPTISVLVRKRCLDEIGFFDESLTALEDWDLWLRTAEKGWLFENIPQVLAHYRRHSNNMTLDINRMERNQLKVLNKLEESFCSDNLSDLISHSRANVFLNSALNYYLQNKTPSSYNSFKKAILIWPDILSQEDTWYRWICADQPPGFQNSSYYKDLNIAIKRITELISLLSEDHEISAEVEKRNKEMKQMIGIAFAKQYYMENNNKLARQQLLSSFPKKIGMLSQKTAILLLIKTYIGQNNINHLQMLLRK